MIKEAIGEAANIGEAKEIARLALNAPAQADVKYDIIAMPQKKLLGMFGGSKAKVRAFYDDGKSEAKAEVKAEVQTKTKAEVKAAAIIEKPKKTLQKKEQPKMSDKKEKPAQTRAQRESNDIIVVDISDPRVAEAKAYLENIIAGLKVDDAKITVKIEDESVKMEIGCEDYGIIIGRRGETLDAIQYLVSLILNKNSDGYIRVSINVGNYRQKREETLRAVAKKNASYVLKCGRRVVLEPMNPYERRIIHTTIQEIANVESRSVGSNNERKVVIELADGVKPTGNRGDSHRDDRRDSRSGNFNRDSRPSKSEETAPAKKPDRSELPKFGKID